MPLTPLTNSVFAYLPSTCVCCAVRLEDGGELRCPPCQAANDQIPSTFSVFRSLHDGHWYPLHQGLFILISTHGERAAFDTLAQAVWFIQAVDADLRTTWHTMFDWPPTSGGDAA